MSALRSVHAKTPVALGQQVSSAVPAQGPASSPQRHSPASQREDVSGVHRSLQPPQSRLSVLRSAQYSVAPSSRGGQQKLSWVPWQPLVTRPQTQWLLSQREPRPSAQTIPQPPQLTGSLVMGMHMTDPVSPGQQASVRSQPGSQRMPESRGGPESTPVSTAPSVAASVLTASSEHPARSARAKTMAIRKSMRDTPKSTPDRLPCRRGRVRPGARSGTRPGTRSRGRSRDTRPRLPGRGPPSPPPDRGGP